MSGANRCAKSKKLLSVSAQIFFIIATQCTKQFFFADNFAPGLAENHFISDQTSKNDYWLAIALTNVFLFRLTAIIFSQLPEIFREHNLNKSQQSQGDGTERDRLVTAYLIKFTTSEKFNEKINQADEDTRLLPARRDSGEVAIRMADPVSEEDKIEHLKAINEARAKLNLAPVNMDDITPHFDATVLQRYESFLNAGRMNVAASIADGVLSIPSVMFFLYYTIGHWNTHWSLFDDPIYKGFSPKDGAILLVGLLAGIYAAKTYITFRVPRSVKRQKALEAAWQADGDGSKLNKNAYRYKIAKSLVTAFNCFCFTFYGSYFTFQPVFDAMSCSQLAFGMAVISSALASHTFYQNHKSAMLAEYIVTGEVPVDSEAHAKTKVGRFLGKTVYGVSYGSAICDGFYSVMTVMFALRTFKLYRPSEFAWETLGIVGFAGFLYWVASFDRSVKYTVNRTEKYAQEIGDKLAERCFPGQITAAAA